MKGKGLSEVECGHVHACERLFVLFYKKLLVDGRESHWIVIFACSNSGCVVCEQVYHGSGG